MLIVNNPSVNKIDIVNRGQRLSIKAKQNGQKLDVSDEQAKTLRDSLKKSHPYLTFGEPAKVEAKDEPKAEPKAEVKDEPKAESKADPAQEPAKAEPKPAAKRGDSK